MRTPFVTGCFHPAICIYGKEHVSRPRRRQALQMTHHSTSLLAAGVGIRMAVAPNFGLAAAAEAAINWKTHVPDESVPPESYRPFVMHGLRE